MGPTWLEMPLPSILPWLPTSSSARSNAISRRMSYRRCATGTRARAQRSRAGSSRTPRSCRHRPPPRPPTSRRCRGPHVSPRLPGTRAHGSSEPERTRGAQRAAMPTMSSAPNSPRSLWSKASERTCIMSHRDSKLMRDERWTMKADDNWPGVRRAGLARPSPRRTARRVTGDRVSNSRPPRGRLLAAVRLVALGSSEGLDARPSGWRLVTCLRGPLRDPKRQDIETWCHICAALLGPGLGGVSWGCLSAEASASSGAPRARRRGGTASPSTGASLLAASAASRARPARSFSMRSRHTRLCDMFAEPWIVTETHTGQKSAPPYFSTVTYRECAGAGTSPTSPASGGNLSGT